MRWLCTVVLALAAASSALAAAGVAVAPHVDPPGTPLIHEHLLAAYRFPLFLMRLRGASTVRISVCRRKRRMSSISRSSGS